MSSGYQKAFVLVETQSGHTEEVLDNILKIEDVKEVHVVPGEWDLMAVVEVEKGIVAPGSEKVGRLVMNQIGKTSHVSDTNTMVAHFSRTK